MTRRQKKPKRDEWLCGYACALANVMRVSNERSIVEMTLYGDGLSIAILKKAGVEPYDLNEIVRAVQPEDGPLVRTRFMDDLLPSAGKSTDIPRFAKSMRIEGNGIYEARIFDVYKTLLARFTVSPRAGCPPCHLSSRASTVLVRNIGSSVTAARLEFEIVL